MAQFYIKFRKIVLGQKVSLPKHNNSIAKIIPIKAGIKFVWLIPDDPSTERSECDDVIDTVNLSLCLNLDKEAGYNLLCVIMKWAMSC